MKRKLDSILGSILVGLLALMVLAVLWQVFSRYILDAPSSFTEELARFLLIWIGTLGAAYASGQKQHLAITILPDRLSDTGRDKLQLVLNVLIIFFSVTVFGIGGSRLVYITTILGQSSASLGIPMALIYAVLPLSGVLIILYKTLEIIHPNNTQAYGS